MGLFPLGALRMIVSCLLLLTLGRAAAHDIPSDVKLLIFVKPEAQQLTLLVRVPMAALREIDVPLRPGGFIDLARTEPSLREAAAVWLLGNLELYEDGQRLPQPSIVRTQISLAADRSFTSYAQALARLAAPPIAQSEQLYWNQQLLDVQLSVPISSAHSRFSVHPRFARLGLRVAIALRFTPLDSGEGANERAFEMHGDPGLVHLDPRWHQAAWRFVQAGVWHILEGTDHLLFLFCLVVPLRNFRALVWMVTAFTAAHTLTLITTALGLGPQGLWFAPFVEALIAASIVCMALANIFGGRLHQRWLMAFAFGLVHGFGFAFALRESLQFAGSHVVSALLAFNAGVELGQVVALLVLVPAVALFLRVVPERLGVIVLSALAAHTAWHWMWERGEVWWKYPLPQLEANDLAQLLAWLTAALLFGALLWLMRKRLARWIQVEGGPL